MIKLANVKLAEVIPPSIAVDVKMQAIADAVDVELNKQPDLIKSIALWAQLNALPSGVLDHLAWQFNVPVWRDSWPQSTKVNVLRTAIRDKSVVGTRGAVERAVQSLGSAVQIVEWFEADVPADPYTFEIIIDLNSIPGQADIETQDDLRRAVDAAKPVRSHYRVILSLKLKGEFGMYGTGRPAVVSVLRGVSKESFDPLTLNSPGWWDMLDVSTLFVDAAGTTPSTSNGDPIGLVKNKGTIGVTGDATQTVSANRPLRATDGVQFDGSSAMTLTTMIQGTPLPVEIWVVATKTSSVGNANLVGNRAVGTGNDGIGVYMISTNSTNAQVRDGTTGTPQTAAGNTTSLVPKQIIRAESRVNEIAVTGNGSRVATPVVPPMSANMPGTPFRIGTGGASPWIAHEVFYFDRILTTGEAAQLRAYLEAKHGI